MRPPSTAPQIPFAALSSRPLRDFPADQAYDIAVARDTLAGLRGLPRRLPGQVPGAAVGACSPCGARPVLARRSCAPMPPPAFWTYLAALSDGPHRGRGAAPPDAPAGGAAPPPGFVPMAFDVPPPPGRRIPIVEQRSVWSIPTFRRPRRRRCSCCRHRRPARSPCRPRRARSRRGFPADPHRAGDPLRPADPGAGVHPAAAPVQGGLSPAAAVRRLSGQRRARAATRGRASDPRHDRASRARSVTGAGAAATQAVGRKAASRRVEPPAAQPGRRVPPGRAAAWSLAGGGRVRGSGAGAGPARPESAASAWPAPAGRDAGAPAGTPERSRPADGSDRSGAPPPAGPHRPADRPGRIRHRLTAEARAAPAPARSAAAPGRPARSARPAARAGLPAGPARLPAAASGVSATAADARRATGRRPAA